MARFRLNDDSLRRVRANVGKWSEKQKRVLGASLASWGQDTKGMVQEELLRVKAHDQGLLVAATDVTPVERRGTILHIAVFNPLEYASVIEFGRQPGAHVPLLPLVGWAGRKGIVKHLPRNIGFGGEWAKVWAASAAILKNMKRGKSSGGKKQPMDPVIYELLIIRLIAKKIFEKGSVGRHPFARVYDRRVRTFRRDIAATARMLS